MASVFTVNDTDITAVADAIRAKANIDTPLIFPAGFTEAIANIKGGAGAPVLNMAQTTLSFVPGNLLGVDLMVNSTPVDLNCIIEGATYDVIWNGTPVKCTAWKFEGTAPDGTPVEIIAVGNTFFTTGTPSAEPFIIGTINGEMTVVSLEQTATVQASVTLNLSGGSSEPHALITVTVKRAGVALAGASVTATKGDVVLNGTTDANGQCVLTATESGTYTIKSTYEGITSSSGSVTVSKFDYTSALTFFTATITVATETGATVTVEKDGKTYTATGEDMQAVFTVYETGTYTVTSSYNGNSLTKTVNVTASTNYDVTIFSSHLVLEETSWEAISALSAEGNPQNYFAIGDTKSVHINGNILGDNFDVTLYAYIIGFNHNESVEGKGIHFGTFKTADGKDVALCDSSYGYSVGSGTEYGFSMGNAGNNNYSYGLTTMLGQTLSEIVSYGSPRYYIAADTTKSEPMENSIMTALPADLRMVLKKSKKYFTESVENVVYYEETFLHLLASYEVTGTISTYEHDYSSYVKQYEYYANGNSKIKYKHNAQSTACMWWLRGVGKRYSYQNHALYMSATGAVTNNSSQHISRGFAPIFIV